MFIPIAEDRANHAHKLRLLSVVIPVFNEEDALPALFKGLIPVLDSLGCEYEIVFIDDGSRDATRQLLAEKAARDRHIKLLGFSRNFGHQPAITAGLDFATGDAVVVMDADLQDPPELLPEMIKLFEQGFEVVSAQRSSRAGESHYKRITASLFYGLMRFAVDERLQSQVGDFRLFSRSAVIAIRSFREQHRFMRGLVAWLGLREAMVSFERPPRAAGVTKYPGWKMLKFAWTAISSFSALPLRLSLLGGMLLVAAALVPVGYAAVAPFLANGAASIPLLLFSAQMLMCGAILTSIGLLGDYVARIYEESKCRPLYLVSSAINIGPAVGIPARALFLPRLIVPAEQFQSPETASEGIGAAVLPLTAGNDRLRPAG